MSKIIFWNLFKVAADSQTQTTVIIQNRNRTLVILFQGNYHVVLGKAQDVTQGFN